MNSALTTLLDRLIALYQATLSPDHGPLKSFFPGGVCRYYPTCSQYARDAVKAHGLGGIVMALKRVMRCHPFHAGGYDPVSSK